MNISMSISISNNTARIHRHISISMSVSISISNIIYASARTSAEIESNFTKMIPAQCMICRVQTILGRKRNELHKLW